MRRVAAINVQVIRSCRKTISIEISNSGKVTVRAPIFCSTAKINKFLNNKQFWISNTLNKINAAKKLYCPLSLDEEKQLRQIAKKELPKKVDFFAKAMGVTYDGIKITSAKKRLGSCSGTNSLCFSLYLMQFSNRLIDYVVVHELAHTIEHNHSKAFYKIIENQLPDYKQLQKEIKGRNCPINYKLLEE